ncbi:DUF1294 domain-containing protein [Tatumella sp. OPLPL6]|uniref:DUF1294 domain-containing protein n=1 Tax=Tatumella sp. OPLPL6 TaxID=1928657 RepID=UPI000C17F4A6|nr:DUF1294 domain-containing protein [Tatumella sp. OPLPL6]PIJ44215.1 hypothetical protein BOM24_05250 [Tatumella sp. OPLPL6]
MTKNTLFIFVTILLSLTACFCPVWLSLVLVNVMTFAMFALDKGLAIKGERRIPERWLLIYSLFFGWLGGLIAQQLFRHKTRKQPFKSLFYLTILLDCIAVILYFSRGALLH